MWRKLFLRFLYLLFKYIYIIYIKWYFNVLTCWVRVKLDAGERWTCTLHTGALCSRANEIDDRVVWRPCARQLTQHWSGGKAAFQSPYTARACWNADLPYSRSTSAVRSTTARPHSCRCRAGLSRRHLKLHFGWTDRKRGSI